MVSLEDKPILAIDQLGSLQVPHVGGLTVFTAAVFIVGEMAGSGVLALPKALADAGLIGILMMLLCAALAAYTGTILGKCWLMVQERYPEFQGQIRYPYPAIGQVTYGKVGRYVVSVSINFTLFGVATVFLLLAAENVQDLVSDLHKDISFCYWLIVLAAFLLPLSWLGTPKDFWPIAVGAVVATSIACVILFSDILTEKPAIAPPHRSPTFSSFFFSYGTISFAFGGHPAFPTFQADMKDQSKFGRSVFWAYTTVLVMYLPIAMSGYFVYGDALDANILNTVGTSPMLIIVQILITLHLFCGFIIVINPFCQEIEEFCNIPMYFNWKRVVSRTVIVAGVLFVAETIPHFGAILALIGGSTTTLLAYICPPLFFLKLCKMEGDWSKRFIPLHEVVFNYEIILLGLVAGAVSTYAAIAALADPQAFTVPCYAR